MSNIDKHVLAFFSTHIHFGPIQRLQSIRKIINFCYTFGWKWWVISFRDYLGLSDACSDDVIIRADRFGFQNFCIPELTVVVFFSWPRAMIPGWIFNVIIFFFHFFYSLFLYLVRYRYFNATSGVTHFSLTCSINAMTLNLTNLQTFIFWQPSKISKLSWKFDAWPTSDLVQR